MEWNMKRNVEVETEIHLTLPNQKSSKIQLDPDEKLWPIPTLVNTDDKEPVVVLLGWAGCEHKYLSKYSDYYLDRGCITLRHITPLRYHFFENQKIPLLAQGIVKYICDRKLDTHPIFFHVFSNGGSYTYSYILKELSKTQKPRLDIQGTIFDSSPCPRNLRKSYEALVSVFANLKSFRHVAAGLVIFFLVCQIFWYHLKTAVSFCIFGDSLDSLENRDEESAPLTNWLERIVSMKNHNFLFLYSDSDKLIPMDQVERFASITASRGSSVKKVRFIGSEHVMHYRRYPKEYGNAIKEFFQSAMTRKQYRTIIDGYD